MPGIPLVTRETSSHSSRSTEQMCREDGRARLSAEEERAAEESLSVYCKPVELYNILQRRAVRNPLFRQRCLRYKIQAKNRKRIQMNISVSLPPNQAVQPHSGLFPLYVWLARLVSDAGVAEYSSIYRYSRACALTNFSGAEGSNQLHAKFILPEMNKLSVEAKSGSLAILLVSFAGAQSSAHGIDLTKGHLGMEWFSCEIWFGSLALSCLNEDKCVLIQVPFNSETVNISQQVLVNISAEEVGAKEKSPYHSYSCGDVSSSSLSHIMRLRAGNITEEFQAVNISVKTDDWRSEKPRRKRPKNLVQNAKHVEPLILEANLHVRGCELFDKADGGKDFPNSSVCAADCTERIPSGFDILGASASSSQAYPDAECVQSVSGNNLAPPAMLQFAKTRKLSIERSDMRKYPMAIEQVLSDRDSEDEVDDDVADFEDRRMLDDFVDVTKDEKQMMHMWNSFVRKQRVLADGHIPWACEAFSRLHGHDLIQVLEIIHDQTMESWSA
ncbi:hypothetical protein Tsubulata_009942 [Turnera subulata]|uniref:Polycomb protein VEFS-Box domain-containing protein n=1 Tax=Turnera subulata TaxID=218843 RepID=A0A9Q0FVQ3_9ROSI|nr:hypothetical protein Tsubulata_009942 [Turnera subulata]